MNNNDSNLEDLSFYGFKEKDYSLVFCKKTGENGEKEILLGKKKRGFGEGKWCGYGGKLESQDQSIKHCGIRELEEECGIKAIDLEYRGVLIFIMLDRCMILNVYVFETHQFDGNAVETEEMFPGWYKETEIPYHLSWKDTAIWLPVMLATTGTFEGR